MGWGGKGKGGKYNGKGANHEYQDWICPISQCSYRNFASRERCRMCEAYPSGGRRQKGGGSRTEDGTQHTTLAQRQTAIAKAQAKHQRREEDLKKELAEVKRQRDAALAAKANGQPAADEGDEDEEMEEDEAEDIEKALTLARKKRRAMQNIWEDDDEEVQQIELEIKRLTKKRDENKPQRVRLRILERKVDKYQKQVDGKAKALDELNERIKGLEAERETQQSALSAATKELDDARAERAAELQRALEEETKGGGKPGEPAEADGGVAAGKAMEVLLSETRARLPNADTEVAKAIDAAMGQLRALLAQLPSSPVHPPPAASASSSSTSTDQQKVDAAAATAAANEAAERQKQFLLQQQEAAQAAAATAVGMGRGRDGDEDQLAEDSDDHSECGDSMCDIQFDRLEGENEQDRSKRVAKMLKERRKAQKEKRAEERRRNKAGTGSTQPHPRMARERDKNSS